MHSAGNIPRRWSVADSKEVYAVRQWVLGRPFDPTTRLPFGLFFAPAIWVAWLIDVMLLSPV